MKKILKHNFIQIVQKQNFTNNFMFDLQNFIHNLFVTNKDDYYIIILDVYFDNDKDNSDNDICNLIFTYHNNICFYNIILDNNICDLIENNFLNSQNYIDKTDANNYFLFDKKHKNKLQFFQN